VLAPEALLDAAQTLAREVASLPEGVPESAKRDFVAQQPHLFES
jgi:hypothetical protein